MLNNYLGAFKKYAQFNGRARRQEFWQFMLVHLVVAIVLAVLDNVLGLAPEGMPYGALTGLYLLAALIPTLALEVRRLHDTDKSGWWLLIGLIPFGGIVLIVFWAQAGHQGPNAHDTDPKGAELGAQTFDGPSFGQPGPDAPPAV
ncbi:DUF805 domain-containing protein [Luteipulveratus sp. YIM 133132]|uniref:DUF805 domain-containing protein n=1 Tax=Luteipulveratus flavus TaxID=3031728 RepID=UPI0023B17672|nr:DUF805 domain-containing protein [Luteipulveratus sp. YIM 133132]MDE9366104.1 DUF805 domain-containing protein [Luteipulveratus sp. YIM 133132]